VKQEIRIKLWQKMNVQFGEIPHTKEDLEVFCRGYIFVVAILAGKIVRKSIVKDRKRHANIDYYNFSVPSDYKEIDFKIDIAKYKKVLDTREFQIFEYLCEIGHDFSNFDSISRQLGYTGKGSAKYNLTNIAKKIYKYQESLQKE
jgi:hypothetical protein